MYTNRDGVIKLLVGNKIDKPNREVSASLSLSVSLSLSLCLSLSLSLSLSVSLSLCLSLSLSLCLNGQTEGDTKYVLPGTWVCMHVCACL